MKNLDSRKNQAIKGKFVEREVIACQSSLVEELIKNNIDGFSFEDIENLFIDNSEKIDELNEKKADIEGQILDLENELETEELDNSLIHDRNSQITNLKEEIETIESEIEDLEREQEDPQEIYEWWLITGWLEKKLKEYSQPIINNGYGIWWGRTCTGQAILLDSVISDICEGMEILEGQKHEWNV